jgi:hypothetical protein
LLALDRKEALGQLWMRREMTFCVQVRMFVAAVLEIVVRRVSPGCTVVQGVVEHIWVETVSCLNEIWSAFARSASSDERCAT